MPELPEVEIVRENLARWTVDRPLIAVAVEPGHERRVHAEEGLEALVGDWFRAWHRRGKYLLGELASGRTVLSHLGMTGKWVATPGERRFQRIGLTFGGSDGSPRDVALVDRRRLSLTWLLAADVASSHPRIASLGPEPWSADPASCLGPPAEGPLYAERFAGLRRPLQLALMDGSRVAGIGNITALEACFSAQVHPATPTQTLTQADWARIAAGVRQHIVRTLDDERGDEVMYVNDGAGETAFDVYGRAGEPCRRCAQLLRSAKLGGRPSTWCPACQPQPTSGSKRDA